MDTKLSTETVSGGFFDPVLGAQDAFRRIMTAFAEPGTIVTLPHPVEAPAPLVPSAAVLLLTLADADAPVFLDPALAGGAVPGWLGFHTGAEITQAPEDASFAVLGEGADPSGWTRFSLGTDSYPDRAATLILPVASLEGGPPLTLVGPGIEATRRLGPIGLPDGFLAARAANAALFPRGHDLVLVCGEELVALPRTTRIEGV